MKKILLSLVALFSIVMSASAATWDADLNTIEADGSAASYDQETHVLSWTAGWSNSAIIKDLTGDISIYDTFSIDCTIADGTEGYRLLIYKRGDSNAIQIHITESGVFSKTFAEAGVSASVLENLDFIRISGKGGSGSVTVNSFSLSGPDVPVYNPIKLYPEAATELSTLTGTETNWANTVVYPKEFAVQGQAFGNGDGSSESTHVTVPENSKLVFNVSQGSTGLGLRVWMWNGTGVTTLYAYPEDQYETANFTEPYKITDAGVYCVNLNGYSYLKGVKAANDWGAPSIKVDYAYIIPNSTDNIAINEARTISSSKILDFSEVTDVEAYIATAVDGDAVTLKQVTGAVPANTGLVLVDKSGKSIVSIPTCGAATEDVTGNLLVATTTATTVEKAASGTNYVLAGSGSDLGWYSINTVSADLAAGKAYLANVSSEAKVLNMVFDEDATAIKNVQTATADNVYYTLQGVRVANPQKGIFIQNGKKVLFK